MCAKGGANNTVSSISGVSGTWRDQLNKRIIMDNGAYMIKFSSANEAKP